MQSIAINGNVIHFSQSGPEDAARTVVFINSLGTDLRIWDAVVAGLDATWRTLRYDMRGSGLSAVGKTPYAMGDHADDLIGLLDRLGISNAILCGVSVGGQIAQEFYARRPDLVKGLVLCATAAKIGDPDFWNQRIALIGQTGLSPMTDAIMERWFSPAYRAPENSDYQLARAMFERQPVAGYVATCAAIAAFDRRADSANIAVPVAVLGGALDGATPPDLVQDFAARIPGATFTLLDGIGHLPCIEAPAEVCGALAGLASRINTEGNP